MGALRRHAHKLAYGLIALALLLTFVASIVGGFRLHDSANLERQTIRTQSLQSAVLQHTRVEADAAYRNVAAHDSGEGARLRSSFRTYLQSPSNNTALLEDIQAELARESATIHAVNPAARRALIAGLVGAIALVLLLVWLFEMERRAGAIDRDNAARAQELLRLRDEFVAVISHELRTPMTSIIGYLELIGEGDAGPLTGEQRAYLAVVQRSTDRLVELVDELLLVAEAGRGHLVLDLDEIESGGLVTDAVDACRPAADTRSIILRAEAGDAGTFRGDRKRLGQMLDNLVSNAIKFTPDGGRVSVRSAQVDGSVLFEVTDSGAGIGAEDREHLFDAFFRSRAAIEGAVPGTGLGLTITKAIVDAHGGSIEVRCPAGGGTTFRVTIPVGTN